MGAKILDWLKVNKATVIGFFVGMIVGAVLGNLGWFMGAR